GCRPIWRQEEQLYQRMISLVKQEAQHYAAMQALGRCSVLRADGLGCEPSAQTRDLIDASGRLADPVQASQSNLRLRPLAVVGFCLRFQPDKRHDREHSGAVLDQSRQLLAFLIQQHGGWFCSAGSNQVLAYFGYPELLESPVALAAGLARAAAARRLDERIQMSIAVHADLA